MGADYTQLAEEAQGVGGILRLQTDELSARLQNPLDSRDIYAQQVLRRRFAEVGLNATFDADGNATLFTAGAPVIAPPSVASEPPPAAAAAHATSKSPEKARPATPKRAKPSRKTPKPTTSKRAGVQAKTPGTATPKRAKPQRAEPEPATPRPVAPESATPQPVTPKPANTELTAANVGEGLFWVLTTACTFFPALAHQLFPGGEVGEKQDAFFTIYIATFPLSIAATFIFLMLFGNWFDNDSERWAAAAGAIVLSSLWGTWFGISFANDTGWQPQGNALAVLFQYGVLALISYAKFYGVALFIASWGSSFFAAFWLREKAAKHGIDLND